MTLRRRECEGDSSVSGGPRPPQSGAGSSRPRPPPAPRGSLPNPATAPPPGRARPLRPGGAGPSEGPSPAFSALFAYCWARETRALWRGAWRRVQVRSGPQTSDPRSLLSFRLESSRGGEERPGAQRTRKGIAQFQPGRRRLAKGSRIGGQGKGWSGVQSAWFPCCALPGAQPASP